MDTERTCRKAARVVTAALALSIVFAPSATRTFAETTPVRILGEARLHEPSPARTELIEWALKRYRAAGLQVPPVEVYFHQDTTGCRGNLGYTKNGQVDLCVRLAMEAGPQRIVLHELAHAWSDISIDDATRTAFMDLRGLPSWNDSTVDWKDRGTEQAAEIIAWGLGDGTMSPMVNGDLDPSSLAESFRMLTRSEPLRGA